MHWSKAIGKMSFTLLAQDYYNTVELDSIAYTLFRGLRT